MPESLDEYIEDENPVRVVDLFVEQLEYAKARIRAKVEHPFHIVRNIFKHRKTRYKGLTKNTAQLFWLFALTNLVLAAAYWAPTAKLRLEGQKWSENPMVSPCFEENRGNSTNPNPTRRVGLN